MDELSFKGRQECIGLKNIAKELKEKLSLKVVSSSAGRSLETSVLLFGGAIEIDCDWLETNGGYLQNIPEKYVADFFKLKNNKDRKYPHGESNSFMQKRVIDSLKTYLDLTKTKNIAIVTHLGPILAAANYLNYEVSNISNLDGIVISNDNKKYEIKTHKKLINN